MDTIMYQRIRELCKEKGITINKLGESLGFAHSYVNKLNGTITPSIETVEKIAAYFGVSVDYLIGRSNVRDVPEDQAEDIRSFQRAYEKSNPDRRKQMMQVLKISFQEEFKEDDEP